MDYSITSGTIIRTIVLAVALVNQLLLATGHSVIPISDEDVNALVSTIFTVVASVVTWWKNNSFTKAALAGDATKESMKAINSKE